MATDITVYLDDEPGELARLGERLGAGGVNIDGFCAVRRGGGQAEIHLLVEDAAAAFEALAGSGIEVDSHGEAIDFRLVLAADGDDLVGGADIEIHRIDEKAIIAEAGILRGNHSSQQGEGGHHVNPGQ